MSLLIKIENDYSDGHSSENTVILNIPEPDIKDVNDDDSEWWDEHVFNHTGDGHGVQRGIESYYTATIVGADNKELIGASKEWG